jgi:hypothetical protein
MPARRWGALLYSAILVLDGAGIPPVRGASAHLVPLIYHGRPLPEVIEDIQPYTRRRIVIDAAAAEFQYSGIVKQEDVDAWISDLPAIYPVTVIDCRTARYRVDLPGCADPTLIVIRSRLNLYQNSLRSALR